MFKYVENMRKDALTIMSKTYGAKHKTTGVAFYDSYPLANLTKMHSPKWQICAAPAPAVSFEIGGQMLF